MKENEEIEEVEDAGFDYRLLEFSGLLKYFRNRVNMTQEQLSKHIGRSRGAIVSWEAEALPGERKEVLPREREDVINLAVLFDLSPRDTDLLLREAGFKPEYSHYALPIPEEQPGSGIHTLEGHDSNIFGYLVARNGSLEDKLFPLRGERVTIGRDPINCDLPIPLDYDQVSRQHMVIYHDKQGVFVEDLNSSNGTYVDGGFRMDKPRLLKPGQHVLLGGRHALLGVCDLEFLDDPGSTKGKKLQRRPHADRRPAPNPPRRGK